MALLNARPGTGRVAAVAVIATASILITA